MNKSSFFIRYLFAADAGRERPKKTLKQPDHPRLASLLLLLVLVMLCSAYLVQALI